MNIDENPLLNSKGLPRFDAIRPEHVVPAIRYILEEAEREFSNLENSGADSWESLMGPLGSIELKLSDVWSPVMHLNGVRNSDDLRSAYEEVQGEMVAFGLRMSQSTSVYKIFKQLRTGDIWDQLNPAQKRVIENSIRNAEMSGIGLNGEDRKLFNEFTRELTQLSTDFSNNLMDVTKNFGMILENIADTKGLPASFLSMAAQSYNQKNPDARKKASPEKGPWLVTLDYPSYVPFMENCQNRNLRETLYREFVSRASSGSHDNKPLIDNILKIRKKLAALLGYETYAELSIAKKMADSVDKVYDLLENLRQAAWEPARQELQELRDLSDKNGQKEPVMNWDVAFWAKRQQEEKFCFTDEQLRPYFALPGVLDGLFALVNKLFGIEVKEADGQAPVWHEDVRFFKIYSENKEIASFYLDPYSRPENKRGGAWMDECKPRYKRSDNSVQFPVAYLICNSTPPVNNAPSLLTFREVETLFHEFGHGLQHMLTTVDYPEVSGINGIEWDAVELASQFMENWCYHKPTLMGIARHYETNEPMPEDLYQKLLASKTFRSGSMMLRQIQVGLLDLELHHSFDALESGKTPFEVQAEVSAKTSVMAPLKEDHFLCSFSHIFSGGYAAGYYSYKWAEVLSADAFSAFEEAGLEDQQKIAETGKKYRETILACGGSLHPMKVFKNFRGREPDASALLRHCGLARV